MHGRAPVNTWKGGHTRQVPPQKGGAHHIEIKRCHPFPFCTNFLKDGSQRGMCWSVLNVARPVHAKIIQSPQLPGGCVCVCVCMPGFPNRGSGNEGNKLWIFSLLMITRWSLYQESTSYQSKWRHHLHVTAKQQQQQVNIQNRTGNSLR